MNKDRKVSLRSDAMLQEMHDHIRRRLERRLEKFGERTDSKAKTEIKKAHEKYSLSSILRKGASCASGVSIATHIAKATHPDLQVKQVPNPNIKFRLLPDRSEVGSHVLPDNESLADATGNGAVNSAAYELYLLLDIRFEGKKFGEWLSGQDKDVLAAFAEGAGTEEAADVYSALLNEKNPKPSADARLKQIYWLAGDDPCDDESYHLLAPLYATALTHLFYAQVNLNTWFYGDQNKAARKALRERTAFEQGYISYPNLAVQKLGGTKPQNISQLNSERGGQNYLLASLPPDWVSRGVTPPLRTESVLPRFGRRQPVRQLMNDLTHWMKQNRKDDEQRQKQGKKPRKTMQDRDLHDDLTASLADELLMFTFELHRLPAGWSADNDCRLVVSEQYWLDPGRAESDPVFDAARRQSDWHAEVAQRVASWLKHNLDRRLKVTLGDPEHDFWAEQIEVVMTSFRRQLDDLQDALRDEGDDSEGDAA